MKSILENRQALTYAVNQAAEVAGYLWQKGWAERNSGNITLNRQWDKVVACYKRCKADRCYSTLSERLLFLLQRN